MAQSGVALWDLGSLVLGFACPSAGLDIPLPNNSGAPPPVFDPKAFENPAHIWFTILLSSAIGVYAVFIKRSPEQRSFCAMVTPTVAFIVQTFFAYRIFIISQNLGIPILIACVSMAAFFFFFLEIYLLGLCLEAISGTACEWSLKFCLFWGISIGAHQVFPRSLWHCRFTCA
jgi:hypothetical protein